MEQAVWQTGVSGALVAEHGGFRLLVTPAAARDLVRYQVTRPSLAGPGAAAMLASGHSSSVRLAMAKAEQVAGRLGMVAGAGRRVAG